MSDPADGPTTLTDDEIHTHRFERSAVAASDDATDTSDDASDAADTGDDSGDVADTGDTGDDS